jgi:ABC-type lipoprotein release transport system permease subunit
MSSGSFGTAVLAVILVGHSFQATFWWSVAFTALAVLPAAMLPARRAAAREPRRAAAQAQSRASQGA